jgi:DNA sulfur modification protein DndC
VTGQKFPRVEDDGGGLRADNSALLEAICGEDPAFFDLQVALLSIERTYRGLSRRTGVFDALQEGLRTGLFGSEEEAVKILSEREERKRWSLDLIEFPEAGRDAGAE